MAVLLSDNFDRANSTTTIGAPQIGPTPVVLAGTGGISSNQLYASAQPMVATWDLATTDVELTMTLAAGSGSLVLGAVDVNNYWQAYFETGVGVTIYQRVTAGANTLYTSAIKLPVAGSVCKFHHKAGIIRAYVDGTLVYRWVIDTPITSTKHGVRSTSTATRFDNLLGEDAPTISEPTLTGEMNDTRTPGDPVTAAGYLYRGRDTKIQDEAAGA